MKNLYLFNITTGVFWALFSFYKLSLGEFEIAFVMAMAAMGWTAYGLELKK